MSQPIPARLLRHTATLYPFVSQPPGGAAVYGAAVNLERIYIEPVDQNAMTSLGEMKNDTLKIFVDTRNSIPAAQTFKPKDKIVAFGLTGSIRKAVPVRSALSPDIHHWELNIV